MRHLRIGVSWVRGIVGETLTPELLIDFAGAFGTFLDGGAVAVGHDSRRSAPMARAAVLAGLQSCGCPVVDLGLVPTPMIQYMVRTRNLAGGISITASHNGMDWNALKFIGRDGVLLSSFQSEEVMDIYHSGEFRKADYQSVGRIRSAPDPAPRYLDFLLKKLDAARIRRAGFKVVTDCCAGAGAGPAREFLERLGCTVTPLYDVPDGEFPHAPEPNTRNMRALASVVASIGADMGFLVNIDGDRAAMVDESGTALSEEYVFPILADYVCESTPGCVVSTLSTSRMVEEVAARHERKVVRARIGEGHVLQRALAERAAIGGEGSGGVAVLKWNRWFDAFTTMGLVLECMARRRRPLSAIAAALPRYHLFKGAVPVSSERMYTVIETFRRRYRGDDPNLEDGVRVDWPDRWLHVRASNTESLIRVIVEAEDPGRGRELYERSMEEALRAQSPGE